jgi:hypothetical protein
MQFFVARALSASVGHSTPKALQKIDFAVAWLGIIRKTNIATQSPQKIALEQGIVVLPLKGPSPNRLMLDDMIAKSPRHIKFF